MNSKRARDFSRHTLVAGVAVVLALLPFHAFLTVWGNSLFGHYTALRLWKEVVLLVACLAAGYLLWATPKLRTQLFRHRLIKVIALYIIVNLVWGVAFYAQGKLTPKAVLYGGLLDLRFLVMFVAAWLAASVSPWLLKHWRRLVVWPAGLVVAFGLLQKFVLPYDFLRHFGYGSATISPYETIDHKVAYIRVASTLRGANLFGGYLIILTGYVGALVARGRRQWLWLAGALALALGLFASGSRAAWLGAMVAAGVAVFVRFDAHKFVNRRTVLMAAVVLVLSVGGAFALRHNDFAENTLLHTDEHSTSAVSSNNAHVSASSAALKQALREPLGRGPGSAGPASFYNGPHPVRIAENYFLQVGQETGWLGLGLFLAIYLGTAQLLWPLRRTPLGLTLLSSLAGLSIMALFMHIWTDDTIAYLWWGLAGIALAPSVKSNVKTFYNGGGKTQREKPVKRSKN